MSSNCDIYDIMLIILCAPNMWYDKCLLCLYHFPSLSSFISYLISIISVHQTALIRY